MLAGRGAERELIVGALEAARESLRVVVLDGVAGIGKSALLRAAMDGARERVAAGGVAARVLRASGDPDEQSLTFGVLEQLTAPWGDEALRDGSAPHDRGAQLVRALGADPTPTWMVLEDAQWSDRASLQAITYALRRLHDVPLAVLVCVRGPGHLPSGLRRLASPPVGCVIHLDGLDVAAAGDAAAAWGHRSSTHVLTRLVEHTGGNPLHLRLVLGSTPIVDLLDPAEVPPALLAVDELVAGVLDGLPSDAGTLVEAAAVHGTTTPLDVLGAVTGQEHPATALHVACEAGLASTRTTGAGLVVDLDHSTRSAVYHQLDPSRRAELHLRVAEALDLDPPSRVRHRLAAAEHLDAGLAAEADVLADVAAEQGDWAGAATWDLAIARCAPDPAERRAAVQRAAHGLVVSGDVAAAAAVLDATTWSGPEPSPIVALVRGRIAAATGALDDAEAQLAEAWRLGSAATTEPVAERRFGRSREVDVRGAAASHLAAIHFARGHAELALLWARRAADVDAGTGRLGLTDVDPISRVLLAQALTGQLAEASEPSSQSGTGDPRTDGTLGRAVVAALGGRPDDAEQELLLLSRRARAGGPLSLWAFTQCWRSAVAFRSGRWDEAVEHAGLPAIVTDQDGWSFAAAAHCCLAAVQAATGRTDALARSLEHARQATAAAGSPELLQHLLSTTSAWVHWLEGDHTTVLELTAAVSVPVGGAPLLALPPPELLRGLSALRAGDAELATACAARLPTWAPWGEWSDALLGLVDAARGRTERGLGTIGQAVRRLDGGPFVLDELLLRVELGAALRRSGRRAPATEQLRVAGEAFDRLGAAPLVARSEAEMALLGSTRVRRHADVVSLTPAEQLVATLAVEGRSNREIAAELVLSVKTIEFHLSNVFRKLGVRNRTELARRGLG